MSNYSLIGSMLIKSGVPSLLLKKTLEFDINTFKFPLAPVSVINANNEPAKITVAKQEAFLLEAHKLKRPYRVLICSSTDNTLSQLLMLKIYTKTARRILKRDFNNFMEWYTPNDLYEKEDEHTAYPYMVVDGIRCIPNQAKLSKVKQILDSYPNPVFVIISGKSPYKFWLDEFGTKPNFVVRVDRTGRVNNNTIRI
jgi:hypothetical protein